MKTVEGLTDIKMGNTQKYTPSHSTDRPSRKVKEKKMAAAPGVDQCDASPIPQLQPYGGYALEIFPSGCDDKFKCNYCKLILKDPLQGFCGHRFCKVCVQYIHQVSKQNKTAIKCPTCLTDGSPDDEFIELKAEQMFPDNAVKREMANVGVVCTNPNCDWTGQFKHYSKHYNECPHSPVQCECGSLVPKSRLTEHRDKECIQRTIVCKYCNQQIQFVQREEHNQSCPKSPVRCDSCGKKKIPKDKMPEHLEKECPNPRLPCPLGCQELVEKSKMDLHLKTNPAAHLQTLGRKLQALDEEIRNQRSPGGTYESAITELGQQVRVLQEELRRVVGNHRGGAVLGATGGDPSGASSPEMLDRMKNYENIAAVLYNENQRCIAELQSMERRRQAEKTVLDAYEQKIRTLERVVALKDVIISEMDLRLLSVELASYDGTLCWKISEFSRKRHDAISGKTTSIYSPAFYTERMGYKMCARLYPNGDGMGKGSHLSLFFVLMRGHFDALLKFPFKQKVTLTLLDQSGREPREDIVEAFRPDPTSSSFKRPTTEMNIASGCPLFMSLQLLDSGSGKYIKDDTIFIKIIVDTIVPAPPKPSNMSNS